MSPEGASIDFGFLDGFCSPHFACLAVVVLTVALFVRGRTLKETVECTGRQITPTVTETLTERLPKALTATGEMGFSRFPDHVHMQGVFLPEPRLAISHQPEPYRFENEFCWGLMIFLFRPEKDVALDAKYGWVCGKHFQNRKRLWEIRYEFHFKVPVEDSLWFGVQAHAYSPLSKGTRMLVEVIKVAAKKILGGSIHYSPGDDPRMVQGEGELPTAVVPLWGFDQFIETPEGETPPSLTDPEFHTLGHIRGSDRLAFVKFMSGLRLRPGPTYTFGFWGISQLFDALKWEVRGLTPRGSIDFNRFCGAPPVYQILYTLKKPTGDGRERRHLESMKNYYIRMPFWSSAKPPSHCVLQELCPGQYGLSTDKITSRSRAFGFGEETVCSSLAWCCTARSCR